MIKGHGEEKRNGKEHGESVCVIELKVSGKQVQKIDCEDDSFRRDDADHDCTDEETIFAFEERIASRAVMLDVKRALDN